MNKTFKLISKNITGKCFREIINICFKYSEFFSLTINFNSLENYHSKKLVSDLSYCLVKTFKTKHWHCYYMLDKNRPLSVFIYKSNERAKQIFLDRCDNIYLKIDDLKFIAKDICFFSNNKLFLGSVSHAGICNIYPNSENMLNSFLNLESVFWEEIDFLEDELIKLII